ncbi:MAG: hypothetical protein KC561_19215, partial [Myxococcales bacterium]|nr:hypothetical protein [Myxococcales bacterium]
MSSTNIRRWAVAQMNGNAKPDENLEMMAGLIRHAASYGVELLAFPEDANFIGSEVGKKDVAEPVDGHFVTRVGEMAREHGLWVLIGSIAEKSDEPDRP